MLLATLCFTAQSGGIEECHPILVGKDTPVGEFTLNKRITESPGYGGDVLQFKDTPNAVFAVHRIYLLNPKEQRAKRLKSSNPADRKITFGCINVDPAVYERLVDCCSRNYPILIK